MPESNRTLSVRLPPGLRERLDTVTAKTRKSRSAIVIDALERQLDQIEAHASNAPRDRFGAVFASAGEGLRTGQTRTADEIDTQIRWLRGRD